MHASQARAAAVAIAACEKDTVGAALYGTTAPVPRAPLTADISRGARTFAIGCAIAAGSRSALDFLSGPSD
ncbi:hypothetical protein [Nocardiopsis chromatogenes]|uniref:hypothetical protein n=1 Tax=Nocardiopsis chromatogenes TaxID=280239 RepID=UPI000344B247|nr:hypothetical protein [Nocardiopsis chromatogenes]